MSWYYNTETGALTSSGAVQGFLQDFQATLGFGVGWHKLNIAANATGVQAAAEAVKEFPAGKAPTTNTATQIANSAGALPGAGTLTEVNSFLSRLTSANTWIRVGEFTLGALLILSGALTLANKNGDITSIAKKVIK
jgi:hypothetical protein